MVRKSSVKEEKGLRASKILLVTADY